jgi:hypothetical protein
MFLEGLPALLDHVKDLTLVTGDGKEFYNYWPYLQ